MRADAPVFVPGRSWNSSNDYPIDGIEIRGEASIDDSANLQKRDVKHKYETHKTNGSRKKKISARASDVVEKKNVEKTTKLRFMGRRSVKHENIHDRGKHHDAIELKSYERKENKACRKSGKITKVDRGKPSRRPRTRKNSRAKELEGSPVDSSACGNERKLLDLGDGSFPSLPISDKRHTEWVENNAPADTEKNWSVIANDGHTRSEAKRFEQIAEQERIKQLMETYTLMDVLNRDEPKSKRSENSKQKSQRIKVPLTESTADNRGKLLNLDKLRKKWSIAFEEWKLQLQNEQRMSLKKDDTKGIICDKESWNNSEDRSTDRDTDDDDDDDDAECDRFVEQKDSCSTRIQALECYSACEKYLSMRYPLHMALLDEDERAVEIMMRLPPEMTRRDERMSPDALKHDIPSLSSRLDTRLSALQLCIVLGKTQLLRALLLGARSSNLGLVSSTFELDDVDDKKRTPLMLACAFGLDESITMLLNFGPKVTAKHAQTGDNALHYVCRFGKTSTIHALLGSLQAADRQKASKGRSCMRQRLLCSRNRMNETPLHIACQRGDVDLVHALLVSCSSSIFEKALAVENSIGHTPLLCSIKNGALDLVEYLLTWRGNQHRINAITNTKTCPLVVAAETKSVEMLTLILEHRHLSVFETFDYSGALYTIISCFQDTEVEAIEAIRLLVQEGANPYQTISTTSLKRYAGCSSLTYAALQGSARFVACMVDCYGLYQKQKMKLMREDPCLRAKSEEYFQSVDKNERESIAHSLEETLVQVMISSFEHPNLSSSRLGCCLVLLKRGGRLTNRAFVHLLMGLRAKDSLVPMNSIDAVVSDGAEFEARFQHEVSQQSFSPYSRPDAQSSSQLLFYADWFKINMPNRTYCDWMNSLLDPAIKDNPVLNIPEQERNSMCLVHANGGTLKVHKEILTKRSGKIEAAIRFEELKLITHKTQPATNLIQIELDLSLRYLLFLLQHCYHGSICYGLSADSKKCCEELLELYHVAVEYLCPSLALECEMRLLSDNPYKCFCCSRGESSDLKYRQKSGQEDDTLVHIFKVKGPSKLLNPHTYLSVISYTEIDSSCNYEITRTGSFGYADAKLHPLCALRAMAWKSILFNFDEVLKTDAYVALCHSTLAEEDMTESCCDYFEWSGEQVAILLLRTVLDELRLLPLDLIFMKPNISKSFQNRKTSPS